MYIEELDDLDNKIINLLLDNARLSFSDIGKQIGISRVSVKKRVENLEKKGVIRGYHTMIDPTSVQKGTKFFLVICTTPDYYEELAEYLSHNKMIRKIYGVTGDCSLHVEGYASNMKNLEYFTNSLYRTAKHGIHQMKLSTVLSTIQDIDGGVEYVRYKEHDHLEEGRTKD